MDHTTGDAAAVVKLQTRGIEPTAERMASFGALADANGRTMGDVIEMVLDSTTGEHERAKGFGIRVRTSGDLVTVEFRGHSLHVPKTEDGILDALVRVGEICVAKGTPTRLVPT